MASLTRVDGGFLIGAQDELIRLQGLTLPHVLVQIQQATSGGNSEQRS